MGVAGDVNRAVVAVALGFLLCGNTSSGSPRTAWGDPDLRGTWPVQAVWDAGIPLQRPEDLGERAEQTDAEFAARLAKAEEADAGYAASEQEAATNLAAWLRATPFARRTSLIVDPPDGRLPPLTAEGKRLLAAGRSTRMGTTVFDDISDFDAFERCLTRGFPAVMLPQPYNNGLRIFQSPGFVVLKMETFGTRVIPLAPTGQWPDTLRAWHGQSRGHWDGDTLVVETSNLVSGDSVTHDRLARAAGPVPGRENAVLPVGRNATVVERFRLAGPDRLSYRVTYSDPATYTAPWTIDLERQRDDAYPLFEYACHEGDTSIRAVIQGSRADRAAARTAGR